LRAYFWANEWTILSTARPGKANSLDPAFAPAQIFCRLHRSTSHGWFLNMMSETMSELSSNQNQTQPLLHHILHLNQES
jgi:hypothetical protein